MSDSKATIRDRILANIDDSFDKTEGSFFYDLAAAVASELEYAYKDQENILNKGFVDTASGVYLDLKAAEQGLTRKPATYATTTVIITGSAGASIAAGDLVASDTMIYEATESKTIAEGQTTMSVTVRCQTPGSAGNVMAGAIRYFPITIPGLTAVTNPEAVTNGYDEETDEELRARYYEKVQAPATSGNKYHYKAWAKEVAGVGDAKVFPLWNGAGTVKIVIIDSNKTAADPSLVEKVSEYIEEVRPIGATVTVESATELEINISATLTIDTLNYTLEEVKENIEADLTAYLADIAFEEDYLSYAKVGNLVLNAKGVLDYSNLTVNSGTSNITIGDTEVAVLGVVSVVEAT